MRIIGIDPGTATTGYAIIESVNDKNVLLDYGCIKTKAGLDQSIRLHQIALDITTLIKKWKPEIASIEKLFFNKNVKTAMEVAQARGVIMQKLTEHGIIQKHYTPLEIKSAICGYGKADKKMVQQMLQIIMQLDKPPEPDDAADAIAAAICLANSIKFNCESDLILSKTT